MIERPSATQPSPAQWATAIGRMAAAEARMEALNGPSLPSNAEMDAAGTDYGEAVSALLSCPAPDADALRAKLELLLTYEEEDGPLLASPDDRAAVLADFDRIASTGPQPVDHEPAAGKIQELALQAGHAQASAMQALHDAGDAPEAALALGALVARLIGEMAEVASKIEAGRPLVEKVASRLVGRPH